MPFPVPSPAPVVVLEEVIGTRLVPRLVVPRVLMDIPRIQALTTLARDILAAHP